jgi:hypothetical protein
MSMLRLQVFTATRTKMTIFRNVVPCSLVDTNRRFRGAYSLHHQSDRPDDGSSKHIWGWPVAGSCEHVNEPSGSIKGGSFLD